jgi:hypothetical protein
MDPKSSASESKPGVSKLKLAVGAASLFLFIVGLKRTFSMDDAPSGARIADLPEGEPTRTERQGGSRGG